MKKLLFLFLLNIASLIILAQDISQVNINIEEPSIDKTTIVNTEDFSKILKKADFHRGGHISGISWELKVENIEKGSLKNEIFVTLEGAAVEEKLFALASFTAPRKYKGQKLLVKDYNIWFVKPGLRSPVAISSRQRLSGSAANADIASANYFHEYTIESTEEAMLDNQPCWVLQLESKSNQISYSKIKYWIKKEGNVGVKAEFYGKSNKLIKSADFEYDNELEYEGTNHPFVSKVTIYDNINKNDKTVLNFSEITLRNFNNSKFQKNRLMD